MTKASKMCLERLQGWLETSLVFSYSPTKRFLYATKDLFNDWRRLVFYHLTPPLEFSGALPLSVIARVCSVALGRALALWDFYVFLPEAGDLGLHYCSLHGCLDREGCVEKDWMGKGTSKFLVYTSSRVGEKD
jgi:hypothetical protein